MSDQWWKVSRGTDDEVFPAAPVEPLPPEAMPRQQEHGRLEPENGAPSSSGFTGIPENPPAGLAAVDSPERQQLAQNRGPASGNRVPALAATARATGEHPAPDITNTTPPDAPPAVQEVPSAPDAPRRHGNAIADLMRLGGSAVVQPQASVAILIVVGTPQPVRVGQVLTMKDSRLLVGRARQCGCILDDSHVADVHAVLTHELRNDEPGYYIYPLPEWPLDVNAMRVNTPRKLTSGDRIAIGHSELLFVEAELRSSVA
jgi:hypothetical protein